ncbi:thiamine kinase [Franconibacter daqui]|uniref:thiamine kinase n=1 Tax=Franconibacter daqui TaxID=2047724 RepID=UPI00166475AF|nr:thiamine kinase [Franconibacter daqui]
MRYSKPSKATLQSLLSRHFPAASAAGVLSELDGLSGGAWRVTLGEREFIARARSDAQQNGVTFSRLYRVLRQMPASLAPQPHFLAEGWLVADYLPGAINPVMPPVPQLASLLYHLHQQPRFGWRVQLLPLLEHDWQACDPARRTAGWLRLLKRLRRQGEPRPLRLAPLHMDVHPGNLVHQAGGIKLIDWEYAGDGDIALELASVWLEEREREALVASYAQLAAISVTALQRQVKRWRPWVCLLMAGWYERRWRETNNRQFIALADDTWRQCGVSGRKRG